MNSALKLGDLEIATLEAIWLKGEMDARAIHKQFSKSRGITLSTVQSTLERLYRKDLLTREKVSHAYVYGAAESRAKVMARLVDEALGRFSTRKSDGLLAAFAGLTETASAETLSALEKLVADARDSRDAK